jgi:hypothetical protein
MYFNDHPLAHVHVIGSSWEVKVSIVDLMILGGDGRPSIAKLRLAADWIAQHEDELLKMWEKRMEPGGIYAIEDRGQV